MSGQAGGEGAVLAIDLGAESGRGVLVRFAEGPDGTRLQHEEVHRFANRPLSLPDGLHWDLPALFREVEACVAHAVSRAREHGCALRSVGVDAWGVDFALLGASGELLTLPRCYRDPRSQEAFDSVLEVPTASGMGLLLLSALLGVGGLVLLRR